MSFFLIAFNLVSFWASIAVSFLNLIGLITIHLTFLIAFNSISFCASIGVSFLNLIGLITIHLIFLSFLDVLFLFTFH